LQVRAADPVRHSSAQGSSNGTSSGGRSAGAWRGGVGGVMEGAEHAGDVAQGAALELALAQERKVLLQSR